MKHGIYLNIKDNVLIRLIVIDYSLFNAVCIPSLFFYLLNNNNNNKLLLRY